MKFILQKESEKVDIDTRILQDELNNQKSFHSYTYGKITDFDSGSIKNNEFNNTIPVGDLNFVSAFLNKHHGIMQMNPIEVPDVLRKDEFLKRKYSIIEKKNLPKTGYYFTKYVSQLKVFSYTGRIETLHYEDTGKEPFLKEGLYQLSESVDMVSEYRCFVHNDKLISINYYDGDCTVFPDTDLLKRAILMYQLDPDRPEAYSIDLAVIRDRGTAILEIHPWVSVGLYSYIFGSNLPYCYRDGFLWYVEKNKDIQKFSNF